MNFIKETYAKSTEEIFGVVGTPKPLAGMPSGEAGIANFVEGFIQILYMVGAIAFIFMLLFSAVQWIASGGNKESLAKAQARLMWAVIGLALLALAFPILRIIGEITGFTFFS